MLQVGYGRLRNGGGERSCFTHGACPR
jgi:hypothetical protein